MSSDSLNLNQSGKSGGDASGFAGVDADMMGGAGGGTGTANSGWWWGSGGFASGSGIGFGGGGDAGAGAGLFGGDTTDQTAIGSINVHS